MNTARELVLILPKTRVESWNIMMRGETHHYKNQIVHKWHRIIAEALLTVKKRRFDNRVDIYITDYVPSRGFDSDNICDKLIIDGLKKGGVIADDSKRYVRWAATRTELDKEKPRLEIIVREVI